VIGKTLGHYQISEKLGEGGMGEVFLARDVSLHRKVALKFLPSEMQQDESAQKRFLREAQSAAALDHPNICTIHEVGHDEGRDFIVMEYVDGQTLKDRLKLGELPFEEAVRIAIEVAEGLAEAHGNGIVHRDLKPSNIMLTRKGHAKIMDFGLAKQLTLPDWIETRAETVSAVTREGTTVGTLAYMSPELLCGEALDARSDIFSLGIVFHEMFGGEHPFRAATPIATCGRILHEAPRPLRQLNPRADEKVENLVARMLAKDLAGRPRDAGELLRELRALAQSGSSILPFPDRMLRYLKDMKVLFISGLALLMLVALALILWPSAPALWRRVTGRQHPGTIPDRQYLAVLPFVAVNGTAETAAYGRGLTETLNARLTRLTERHSLQVVPAGEVQAQEIHTIEQARREFGVNLVLQGSLQQAGGMLRVTYALADARTRRQLRADAITATAADPFAVEDLVVASVLSNLEIEIQPHEKVALAERGTRQPEAYDYYLRGRGYLQDYHKVENIQSAIDVFQRALDRDPKYAPALAGLGMAYWQQYQHTNEGKWVDEAQSACERAVALDAGLSSGHSCLGIVFAGRGGYEQAVQELQRAVLLEPTSDDAYRGLASAYERLGRLTEAERTYRRAIDLRPQYWAGYNWLGGFYGDQGRYADAAAMFTQATRLAPDHWLGYSNLGAIYHLEGRYAEAIPMFERAVALRPTGDAYSNLGTACFLQRKFVESARAYEEAVKLDEKQWLLWGNLADGYRWAPGMQGQAAGAYRKALALGEERLQVNPHDATLLGYMAYYHAMLHERIEAQSCERKALAVAPGDPELLFNLALAHNQLGETGRALDWLTKALAAGYSHSTVRDTPLLDNLRTTPGFLRLLHGN
jgi:tetratricopeptide (TPR) repeat protein/predicted Ser/Thr protein kinase